MGYLVPHIVYNSKTDSGRVKHGRKPRVCNGFSPPSFHHLFLSGYLSIVGEEPIDFRGT